MSRLDLLVAVVAVVITAAPSFAQPPPGQDTEQALHDTHNPIATRINASNRVWITSSILATTNSLVS